MPKALPVASVSSKGHKPSAAPRGDAAAAPSPEATSAGDLERVRRARAGDATAFEELYRQYRPAVFKVAHGVTGNVEDSLDVTQETFLKAHRSLELFEGRASVLTWLCQIAIHQAIDLGRRKKIRRAVELDDYMRPMGASHSSSHARAPGDEAVSRPARLPDHLGPREELDPVVLASGNELKDALHKALAGLSEKHREVFLLYTLKGLSYQEIADSLEVSIGTVMSRLFYARKNLQGLLAEFSG
jgi:RNA polymerase sigma-70 factor (ECF subfamily)